LLTIPWKNGRVGRSVSEATVGGAGKATQTHMHTRIQRNTQPGYVSGSRLYTRGGTETVFNNEAATDKGREKSCEGGRQ